MSDEGEGETVISSDSSAMLGWLGLVSNEAMNWVPATRGIEAMFNDPASIAEAVIGMVTGVDATGTSRRESPCSGTRGIPEKEMVNGSHCRTAEMLKVSAA